MPTATEIKEFKSRRKANGNCRVDYRFVVVEREKGVATFKYDGEFASIETDGFFVLCMKKRNYSFWQSRLWFKAFDATKYKLEKTETVLAKH